jgi:hypothetical protein
VTFDEIGLTVDGPLSSGTLLWEAVRDVTTFDGGIFLRLGGASILILDADLSPQSARGWIIERAGGARALASSKSTVRSAER